jgi:hypothetical protein
MEMKKLKVVTTRMAGYTGVLGPVRFKDGVSEEYLPRHIRDRMAAAMELIEVDQDGNEQPAGAQHRLLREYKERAPKLEPLVRQTDAEKTLELTKAALNATKVPTLETRDGLEKIAEKGGIKALREIGVKWNVKHRSIPTLIEMILDAQEKGIAARNKKLADKIAQENEKLQTTAPQAEVAETEVAKGDVPPAEPVAGGNIERPDETVTPRTANAAEKVSAALAAAASTGDLAASLSTEQDAE